MRDELKILGIAGSLRAASLNARLIDAAAELAPAGMHVQRWHALGEVPPFDEDLEAQGVPASVRALAEAVAAADGLLIATPEYNQSFPGVLKNAIDWLSRDESLLAGKPVALLGATAGRWGTRLAQAGLRHVFAATESLVLPAPMVFLAGGERLFDDAGILQAAEQAQVARLLGTYMGWIRALHQPMRSPLPPKSVGASA